VAKRKKAPIERETRLVPCKETTTGASMGETLCLFTIKTSNKKGSSKEKRDTK